jgi:hypothetical protein
MPRGGAGDGFHRRSRMGMKLLEFAEWGKDYECPDF